MPNSVEQEGAFTAWLNHKTTKEPAELDLDKLAQTIQRADSALNQVFQKYCPSSPHCFRALQISISDFNLLSPWMSDLFNTLWKGIIDARTKKAARPDYINFHVNRMPEEYYSNLLKRSFATAMMTAYSGDPLGSLALTMGKISRNQEGVSVSLKTNRVGFYEAQNRVYVVTADNVTISNYAHAIETHPLAAASFAETMADDILSLAGKPKVVCEIPSRSDWRTIVKL